MDITINDLPALKKAYNKAKKASKTKFEFKGYILLIGYAQYMIEYYELSTKNT